MSGIYPVEDLRSENNSVGNGICPTLMRLNEGGGNECRTLLDNLQSVDLRYEHPLWEILGLAVPVGSMWKELRIGELKTLLALAISDTESERECCDCIHHYREMKHWRWPVYRCIEALLNLDTPADFRHWFTSVYGEEGLLDGKERLFGLLTLGPEMEGRAIQGKLLAAYDKLFVPVNKH